MSHSPNDLPKCNCQSCKQCLLASSAALYALRDALMELSLALKDWQFELDSPERSQAEIMVREALLRVAAKQNPTASP